MTKEEIINAYIKIRMENHTIPDDVLDYMKYAALEKLSKEVNQEQPTNDTIIPVKFIKKLSVKEIDGFVDAVNEFAECINTEASFISFSAVKTRLENNNQ